MNPFGPPSGLPPNPIQNPVAAGEWATQDLRQRAAAAAAAGLIRVLKAPTGQTPNGAQRGENRDDRARYALRNKWWETVRELTTQDPVAATACRVARVFSVWRNHDSLDRPRMPEDYPFEIYSGLRRRKIGVNDASIANWFAKASKQPPGRIGQKYRRTLFGSTKETYFAGWEFQQGTFCTHYTYSEWQTSTDPAAITAEGQRLYWSTDGWRDTPPPEHHQSRGSHEFNSVALARMADLAELPPLPDPPDADSYGPIPFY